MQEVKQDLYPGAISSLIPSLHDTQYYQSILENPCNFASETHCDVFEVDGSEGVWSMGLDEHELKHCLRESKRPNLRAIFCPTNLAEGGTFRHQVSLTRQSTVDLFSRFEVSPQFLAHLLAEPDYWAPGDFATHDDAGDLSQLEFFCQHPRWNIHVRTTPWCIYMKYNVKQASTTYIIVCGTNYNPNEVVKRRLGAPFNPSKQDEYLPPIAGASPASDPFFLHSMIFHEAISECKTVIGSNRRRLYDQLDKVDEYAKTSLTREALQRLTIELHGVSQDTDSLMASAEMAQMIATSMSEAHKRFEALPIASSPQEKDTTVKIADSLAYFKVAMAAQKRWLHSYASRKDIAMNLVFNLVTQQDTSASLEIAVDAKADSASMKTIAVMTMLFLPGAFVSQIFSLDFVGATAWWVYVALTLPLTMLVLFTWWFYTKFPVKKCFKEVVERGKGKEGGMLVV